MGVSLLGSPRLQPQGQAAAGGHLSAEVLQNRQEGLWQGLASSASRMVKQTEGAASVGYVLLTCSFCQLSSIVSELNSPDRQTRQKVCVMCDGFPPTHAGDSGPLGLGLAVLPASLAAATAGEAQGTGVRGV